jgi:hypothetical protein
MKIALCGSISAGQEILTIKTQLETAGHEVEIPESLKHEHLKNRTEVSVEEKAQDKIKHDLIRRHFEKIKTSDCVVVVNVDKRGVKNYIGGNTFLEMGFAHVLNKKIYCLNPLPQMAYTAELAGMQPIILNGDLSLIK